MPFSESRIGPCPRTELRPTTTGALISIQPSFQNFQDLDFSCRELQQYPQVPTNKAKIMGSKIRKRDRDSGQGESVDEAPVKRRRQLNEDHLKLSKLYEDLAAESDDVRFEAAKQLIVKFSPDANPNAKDVETTLGRLIKGLCSQRKAARVGFSLTLTELLREIFGSGKNAIEGLDLDVTAIIKLVEEKTKVEGNVPGRVRLQPLTVDYKRC